MYKQLFGISFNWTKKITYEFNCLSEHFPISFQIVTQNDILSQLS
jgi:hypothetical protein